MFKKIIYIFIGIGLFLGLFWYMSQPPKDQSNIDSNPINNSNMDKYQDYPVYDNPDLVFFWGNGCPHCENVENWIKDNQATEKIKINFKEVYYNKENQTDLSNIAKEYCPEIISNGGVGIPTGFDFVNKKCIQGDTPLIEFLSSKLAN